MQTKRPHFINVARNRMQPFMFITKAGGSSDGDEEEARPTFIQEMILYMVYNKRKERSVYLRV